jgi:hypothetical protein
MRMMAPRFGKPAVPVRPKINRRRRNRRAYRRRVSRALRNEQRRVDRHTRELLPPPQGSRSAFWSSSTPGTWEPLAFARERLAELLEL